jgi:hypothetical protein
MEFGGGGGRAMPRRINSGKPSGRVARVAPAGVVRGAQNGVEPGSCSADRLTARKRQRLKHDPVGLPGLPGSNILSLWPAPTTPCGGPRESRLLSC